MDDALARIFWRLFKTLRQYVLILVVMDDALALLGGWFCEFLNDHGLNPCCNG